MYMCFKLLSWHLQFYKNHEQSVYRNLKVLDGKKLCSIEVIAFLEGCLKIEMVIMVAANIRVVCPRF